MNNRFKTINIANQTGNDHVDNFNKFPWISYLWRRWDIRKKGMQSLVSCQQPRGTMILAELLNSLSLMFLCRL
jgi:hypothetical protein